MKLKQPNPKKILERQDQKQKLRLKAGEVKIPSLTRIQVILLSGIVLLLGFIHITLNTKPKQEIAIASASVEKEKEEISNYEAWMFMIKAKESFQPEEYDCPAGFKTIGFGYNIDAHGYKPIKQYMVNGKITYAGATEILKDQAEQVMSSLVNVHKLTHLTIDQQRAVASLILNCGESKIKYTRGKKILGKSKFWKTLEAGHIPDFTVYSKYRTPKGKVKFSPTLLNARKFEQALFVGDKKTIQRIGRIAKKVVIERDIRVAKEHGLKI